MGESRTTLALFELQCQISETVNCLQQETTPFTPKSDSSLLVSVTAGRHLVVYFWYQWHNRFGFTGPL